MKLLEDVWVVYLQRPKQILLSAGLDGGLHPAEDVMNEGKAKGLNSL